MKIESVMTKRMRERRILSGAMHYFRMLPEQWEDRLDKMVAMGLNTVETYMAWSLHEPREGEFDFSGRLDYLKFIRLAQSKGLDVLLRPGPYICSECDWGALPWWLMRKGAIIRSSDPTYLQYAFRFLQKVCDDIQPLLAENGGPIIGVQVENEYGDAYIGDGEYMRKVRDLYLKNGITSLFTSGWATHSGLNAGATDGVLATCNFRGPEAKAHLNLIKTYRPEDPTMVMEYWTGRSSKFELGFGYRSAEDCAKYLKDILDEGASVNLYCFFGGTNYGFFNGANYEKVDGKMRTVFQATTYDGDFPLTEYGQITQKYALEQKVLCDFLGKEAVLPKSDVKTRAYASLAMAQSCDLLDHTELATQESYAVKPQTMEFVGEGEGYGYVSYTTKLFFAAKGVSLKLEGVHDKASVYADGKYVGTIDRDDGGEVFFDAEEGTEITIFVESLGRINFGRHMETDAKGLIGNVVLFGDKPVHGFTQRCYPMRSLPAPTQYEGKQSGARPAFYRATLSVDEVADTFAYPSGFTRGVLFVNGFNVGRFWQGSAFQSVYIPAPLLKKGDNEIVFFDALATDEVKSIDFKAKPHLWGASRFSDPFNGELADNEIYAD